MKASVKDSPSHQPFPFANPASVGPKRVLFTTEKRAKFPGFNSKFETVGPFWSLSGPHCQEFMQSLH